MMNKKFKEVEHLGYHIASGLNDKKYKQTDYQADEYERFSEAKAEQREKILKFILDNHEINPRYFGLPGKYWIFENALHKEVKNCHIMGIEKDLSIFEKSASYMPGMYWARRQIFPWAIDHRIESTRMYKASRQALNIAETVNTYHIHGDLVSLTDKKIIEKARFRGPYKKHLRNRTAIWYDFTSPFNVETYTAIYNINNIIHKGRDTTVCLTLMYGRDQIFNGNGEEARVEIVEKVLPDFDCKEVWTYKGFKETPMINICGILKACENDDDHANYV